MKKLLFLVGSFSILTTPVSTIVSCGGKSNTLRIAFVPSRNATDILKTVKPLEEKLKNKLKEKDSSFNKNVEITAATNYEAAGDSMKKGKSDLAFLPINTYESYRGDKKEDGTYSKAGILLVSSRESLAAESNFEEFKTNGKFDDAKAKAESNGDNLAKLSKNYNQIIENILKDEDSFNKEKLTEKLYNKDEKVSYYRSYIYANKKFIKDTLGEEDFRSKENAKKLIKKASEDKKLSLGGSPTSSASVLYPLLWMKEHLGLDNNELKNIYENKYKQASYTDAAEKVSNGTVELAVGYADIRYDINDPTKMKDAYKNTQTIGASRGIPNDGIMYSRETVDETLANNLRESFLELVADKANSEIFDIYSHKGYVGVGSKTSIEYEKEQDQIITDNLKSISIIQDLLKEITS